MSDQDYNPVPEDEPTRNDLLWRGLRALPFMDELFFGMQARNLVLVDYYICQWEREVLRVHIDLERTPVPQLMTLSAFSQLWIFGVYELLRTWRQQCRFLLELGRKLAATKNALERDSIIAAAIERASSPSRIESPGPSLVKSRIEAVGAGDLVGVLDGAIQRVEPLFRRLETLRVTIAKHEIPKTRSAPSMSPGYARQDMTDGCLIWPVELKDGSLDLVSRTAIVEGIIGFAGEN